jgi:short-subunit dehydrogenase
MNGIGAATALEFASKGCRVALAARSEDLLKDIAEKAEIKGGHAISITTDVSKIEDIKNLGRVVLEKWGQIDVWINNAGINVYYDSISAREDWVDLIFRVNLLAVYWGMRAAARAMMQNQCSPRGVIVNVSSIIAEAPVIPRTILYKATKAGVDVLSEGIGLELLPLDIAVINVKPGTTLTEFDRHQLGVEAFLGEVQQSESNREKTGPPGFSKVSPEVVARKILQEVQKGVSNPRVLITKKDRLSVFMMNLLSIPIGRYIRRFFENRELDPLLEDNSEQGRHYPTGGNTSSV